MLKDTHISHLVDYANSADCFNGVNIAGGICYFLWNKNYSGECMVANNKGEQHGEFVKRKLSAYPVFVRDNQAIEIIRRIRLKQEDTLDKSVFARNSFTLASNVRGTQKNDRSLLMLSSDGYSYIDKSQVSDRFNILNKYKVIITYAMSGGNKPGGDGMYQIISSLSVLKPLEVCTETYLVLRTFDNEKQASNMCTYVKTKFFRFLLLQALSSIHITKSTFLFVPLQDFNEPWTDEKLYAKYGLDEKEIAFIESMIRPME